MIKYKKTWFFMLIICLFQIGIVTHAEEKNELLQYLTAVAQGGPIYEVIVDGTGDFTSIQEAVEQVESGTTLLIYPGVYEEYVEIIDKTVNLIGTNKEECILISDTKDYHHIPLTVAAGTIYNMTICGSNPTKENIVPSVAEDYDTTDLSSVYDWQSQFPGYAIHIDQDYAYGRELLIEGCRIISDSNYCVGIGCRGWNTITFADCQFFSNGGGCIFLHNTQTSSGDGEAYFIMKDCELRNYLSPYVISVQSTGDVNPTYLTFQNVKVSTIAYEAKRFYNNDNMNTWYNLDQLNDPKIRKLLANSGYYTTLKDDLIQNFSCETWQTMQLNRNRESLLEDWPDFGEGIHYIREMEDKNDQNRGLTLKGARMGRYVINISNPKSDNPKDGWCGLYNIYLTQQSFGNTLIEMNYPITVSSERIE